MSSFDTLSTRIKIPLYARKKTEDVSNRVLSSLLSQAATKVHRQEAEDKTKEYFREMITDLFQETREKFGYFDTMSSRLEAVEESVMFVEKTMETRKAEQQQYAHILACNANGQLTNTENVLYKIEALIAGLLNEMKRQGTCVKKWRAKFRDSGLFDRMDEGNHDNNIMHKVTRLETRIEMLEREQREWNHQQYCNLLDVHRNHLEDRDAYRNHEQQQMEERLVQMTEQMHVLQERLNKLKLKTISEDILMETHANLIIQMQGQHKALNTKLKHLTTQTEVACHGFGDGLRDVQEIEDELKYSVSKVHALWLRKIQTRTSSTEYFE